MQNVEEKAAQYQVLLMTVRFAIPVLHGLVEQVDLTEDEDCEHCEIKER